MLEKFFGFFLLLSLTTSCMSSKRADQTSDDSDNLEESDDESPVESSTYLHSLTNNPLSSKISAVSEATKLASKLLQHAKKETGQTVEAYESLIAAERIARAPLSRLLVHMRRLAEITRKKDQNQKISERARLELAIAAIQQNQFGMAFFLLSDLEKARDRKVQAGAFNALANIAVREKRIPEAIEYWKQSLKAYSNYQPALFNLGFMSLKFGHFAAAKNFLQQLGGDWFAESGLLVAARLTNETETTSRLCTKILSSNTNHKPTVFNCGIHEWQSNKNIARAKELVGQALKTKGGPSSWDNHGYRVLQRIK